MKIYSDWIKISFYLIILLMSCITYGQQEKTDINRFSVTVSNDYALVSSLKLQRRLYVKKRNCIWVIQDSQKAPRLLAKLPNDKVSTNCNMLFHDGGIFVSHDDKIFRVHAETGEYEIYVKDVLVAQLLGFNADNSLIALVDVFFGEASGSEVKTFLVHFDSSGKGETIKNINEDIFAVAMHPETDKLAICHANTIKLFSASNFDLKETIKNTGCVRSVYFVNSETLLATRENFAGENIVFRLTSKGCKKLGGNFSAVAAGQNVVVAMYDDSSIYIRHSNDEAWLPIICVSDCDNSLYGPSYAKDPVLSPSERYVFSSLACHKKKPGFKENGKFSSKLRSMIIDLKSKHIRLLDQYYAQGCWGGTRCEVGTNAVGGPRGGPR